MNLLPISHRRQQQQADCLAACAAMVLDYLQVPISYDRLLRLLNIRAHGAAFANLRNLANLGVAVVVAEGDLEHLQKLLALVGLVVLGFGVGSLFPLGLSTALNMAVGQSDAASARVSMGSGLAILLAPFTLGWLADAYDLGRAFAIVVAICCAAIVVTAVTNRAAARQHADTR